MASKSKVKKGKKVGLGGTMTSPVDGSCTGGQNVTIERAKPGSTAFAPFAGATTDGNGGFSLKVKAKKTFTYMAHVDATSKCGGSDSNTVKVKVARRRSDIARTLRYCRRRSFGFGRRGRCAHGCRSRF